MRSAIVASIVGLSATALAVNHGHQHARDIARDIAHVRHSHYHERARRDVVDEKIDITVTECWLGGSAISQAECDEGIRNGTLRFVDDGFIQKLPPPPPPPVDPKPAPIAPATRAATTPKPPASPAPVPDKAPQAPPAAPQVPAAPVNPPPPPPAPEAAPKVPKPAVDATYRYGAGSAEATVYNEFPDGQLDCSGFPDGYGALRTPWLGLGGWAGVQKPNTETAAGYSDIMDVVQSQCPRGDCCREGAFCSYACPNGFLKSQWPSRQGATGQSVGGLYCQNGKLHLTRPDTRTLCAEGSQDVKVKVQNNLSQHVAICRTNYPGDEKMSIPLSLEPGAVRKLACPDSSKYYKWQGRGTSAQYYMNMPGYSVEKACVWGEPGDDFGNWAPANLGVGWADGRAWLSIIANHPTQTNVKLPYTIELLGGNSKCRYRGGQYCVGDNYESCNDDGCTVSSAGGELTYVLS